MSPDAQELWELLSHSPIPKVGDTYEGLEVADVTVIHDCVDIDLILPSGVDEPLIVEGSNGEPNP